jgi:hypothetical protein
VIRQYLSERSDYDVTEIETLDDDTCKIICDSSSSVRRHQILRSVDVQNWAVPLRSASIPHSLGWVSRSSGQS